MIEVPETSYVETPGGQIAYRSFGEGSIDVLVHTPIFIPVDLLLEQPVIVHSLERLSGFCRHIWFDPRDRGGSDPSPHDEGRYMDSIVDDMLGVLDGLGCERAVVLDIGSSAGFLFAATHPGRTTALIHYHPATFFWPTERLRPGTEDEMARRVEDVKRYWGRAEEAALVVTGFDKEPQLQRWLARSQRLSCPPEVAAWRIRSGYLSDIRDVLPTIRVPTLIISGPAKTPTTESRYLAEHIAGSRLVQMTEEGGPFLSQAADPFIDAIEEFLTGQLPTTSSDRVLATVMFTDLVDSTSQAARLGDKRWRETLDSFEAAVRQQLGRFRGREVKTTGDGVLATFDGPGRAIRCAQAIGGALQPLGLALRVGLHAGEIELRGDDIAGIAVHTAQRVSALARPNQVLVSSTVRDLVAGSAIDFEDHGEHELKGVPGIWRLFAVRG